MSSYHGAEHGRRIWMMTLTMFMYPIAQAQKWRACLVQKSQRNVATTKGIVKWPMPYGSQAMMAREGWVKRVRMSEMYVP